MVPLDPRREWTVHLDVRITAKHRGHVVPLDPKIIPEWCDRAREDWEKDYAVHTGLRTSATSLNEVRTYATPRCRVATLSMSCQKGLRLSATICHEGLRLAATVCSKGLRFSATILT